jgi:hypothetical protein
VVAPSAFVSTLPVVLAVCLMTLVISPSTVVLLVLVLLSSKLKDNDGASAAAGGSGNGKIIWSSYHDQHYHRRQKLFPFPPWMEHWHH